MKRTIIPLCLFLFFLSACGNSVSPVTVTATPHPTPWITYTPSPYPGAITTTPEASIDPFRISKEPPVCTFPLPQSAIAESVPENYIFSKPKEIMSPELNEVELTNIIDWLPDNQRVLLVQDFQDASQSTEILNTQTGAVQVYSYKTNNEIDPPVWVDGLVPQLA